MWLRASTSPHRLQFVGRFCEADLCKLLNEITDCLLTTSAKDWFEPTYTPGLHSVWRMMIDRRPQSEKLTKLVSTIICKWVADWISPESCQRNQRPSFATLVRPAQSLARVVASLLIRTRENASMNSIRLSWFDSAARRISKRLPMAAIVLGN